MSVLLGKGFSAGKVTEENSLVNNKKHSKASVTHKSSVQENSITKRVDSSKQYTPVLTQRQALGDLSNTAIKPVQQGSKPKNKTVLQTKESVRHEVKEAAPLLTDTPLVDDFPDIEYMPPSVDQEPTPYKTPSYFKGILLGAMKTNPFKYTTNEEDTKRSGKESSMNDDLPNLFYQLDIGSGDYMCLDLPDIDELNF